MPNDKKQQHCSLEFPPHVTQRQEHPYKLSDRGLRVEFWVTNCRACSVRRRWFSVLPHATISHLTSNCKDWKKVEFPFHYFFFKRDRGKISHSELLYSAALKKTKTGREDYLSLSINEKFGTYYQEPKDYRMIISPE